MIRKLSLLLGGALMGASAMSLVYGAPGSTAIAAGDVAAVNYLIAEKYVGALGQFAVASNQKVMILPMDTAGLAGTLAGIAEVTRNALSGDSGGAAPARPATKKPGAVPASGASFTYTTGKTE